MLMNFLADISKAPYCEVQLNDERLKAFIYAVKNHYWYQMYIDDLPIWGEYGVPTVQCVCILVK